MLLNTLKNLFDFSIPDIRHAWRIGTVAVIAYLLSTFVFHFDSPQWVILTAIVCSQGTLGSTMRKSKQRLIGTILGCAFGFLAQYLFASHAYVLIGLFFLSFVVALQFIARSHTIYVAFFTFAFVLMLFFVPTGNFNVPLLRFQDVVIGILIGTISSFALWPDFASKMFAADMSVVVADLNSLFQAIIQWIDNKSTFENVMQQKSKSFNSSQAARNRLAEIYYEFGLLKYPVRKYEKFIISQERIHYSLLLIVQSIRYAKEMSAIEQGSLHALNLKLVDIQNQYVQLVRKIPTISAKTKSMVVISLESTEETKSISPKLKMYLKHLEFELKEMAQAIGEMIEYEG